jgi:hypothetical protein
VGTTNTRDVGDRLRLRLGNLCGALNGGAGTRRFGPRLDPLSLSLSRLRRNGRHGRRLRDRGRNGGRNQLCRRLGRKRDLRRRRLWRRRGGGRSHDGLDWCNGLGARLRLRRRGGNGQRRQERERVDVALVVCCPAQAEVHERLREVDDATGPDAADRDALCGGRAAADSDGAEMDEGRGVAERRLDRHRLAPGRHGARERDDPVGRRYDVAAGRSAEVDPAMLSGGIRVRPIERERPQHRTGDRPRPCLRDGWE